MMNAKSTGGFSLLEVMVASAILLIGISGMVSAVHSGRAIQARNQHSTTALEIAEREIERLFILPGGNAALSIGDHGPFEFDRQGDAVGNNGHFTMDYSVSTLAVAGVEEIDMKVAWQFDTRTQSVTLKGFRR